MIIRLKLTEEHLKLLPIMFIQEDDYDNVIIDRNQMFIGSHLLEDIAMALGLIDKAIPNTENDADGRAFDDETEKHMLDVFNYLNEHLYEIETLIHQFVVKGGITAGTYKCIDSEYIWEKED